jgi:hypothetical protein
MHLSHLLGAGAAIAVCGWLLTLPPVTSAARPAVPTPPLAPPAEPRGHYVLVVEGDRDALAITAASHKPDPWAGAPKGLVSAWRLRVLDARGERLADVPLDLSPFDTSAGGAVRGARVAGCVVTTPHIGMLVNAPAFVEAASYTFVRPDGAGGELAIGTTSGARVRELTGGGR